jgi:hypothetical protein
VRARDAERSAALAAVLIVLGSCASTTKRDDRAFLEHVPRSILVLPPLDETMETEATYGCLSTITRPLAERGYYVFPVALVDMMMRENGLPTPYEMHQVSLEKLDEVFHPDAVLYLTVKDWGTSYKVLASVTRVTIEGVLVDVDSGEEIWHASGSAERNSNDSSNGIIGMLASAVANQIATSISDPSRDVSMQASWSLFSNRDSGLLYGPYHPDHEQELEQARRRAKEPAAAGGT